MATQGEKNAVEAELKKSVPPGASISTVTPPELLRHRLQIFFGIGLAASLAAFVADRYIYERHGDTSWSPFHVYFNQMFLSHTASFLLGLFLIWVRPWSSRVLQVLDFLVISFNLLLMTFAYAVFSPRIPGTWGYAIILFSHAAFIPTRVAFQACIGVTATVAYFVGQLLAYRYFPEVREIWNALGGWSALRASILGNSLDIIIVAAISVLVTKTLYNIRFNLSRAQRVGNYFIKGEIGRGGMGAVFEASHAFLARPTAIKIMTPKGEDAKAAIARFEKEVKLSASLSHPNTITIFDYGHCCNNTFYYAMELLEGADLQKLIEKFGPLPANRTAHILRQVCGSLTEAHEKGIIHRDIKPSNVYLTIRGGLYDFVKVLDFGLAKEFRNTADAGLTQSGIILGTPRFLAPESVHSRGQVDGRTDIYMLGSVAYWILTGRPPFEGSSSVDLIVDHLKTIPKPPSQISELPIPEEMDAIVMRCLEKNPDDRFQTPAAMSLALESLTRLRPWNQLDAKEWWLLHLAKEGTVPQLKAPTDMPGVYQPVKEVAAAN